MVNVPMDSMERIDISMPEIEIEFDANGNPLITEGVVPTAITTVGCVWSLQRCAGYDNMYTMLYTYYGKK